MISRVFGLLRDIAVAGVYGATGVTDIFFVAFAIPNLFRQFFAEGAIASAYVPILSDKKHKDGAFAANSYLTQLITVQTLLVVGVSLILAILAEYIIVLFMPGIIGNQYNIALGGALLRIVVPYLLFISIAGILAGYLNLCGSYFIAYASTAALNIMMIMGAAAGYHYNGNIYPLAFSVILGGLLQLLIVYSYAHIKGFRMGSLTPPDPDVKRTYKLVVPSLAGVGISQLNFLVGRVIASFLQPGSISWLFYANRLFQFPLGVFAVTISTVSLTEFSVAKTHGDKAKVQALLDKAIILVLLIIIPSTIGLVGLAEELIDLIYRRNAFGEEDTLKSAAALQMYGVGLIFYSLAGIFTRVFHSDKDTATPVKVAGISFAVNLVLNLLLMKPLGHAGIALASSVAAMVNAVLLYVFIKDYRFSITKHASKIIKIMISSYLLLGALAVLKMNGVHTLINVAVSAAVYFGALVLLKFGIKEYLKKG
ncbi:MAG: murein biosynthesis integral membrane protein MurJ [Deferribacteraceae bacterium]|nr:murein biosynthesis integral membrane protein MurJ [Deferribacteraceae bacterium]